MSVPVHRLNLSLKPSSINKITFRRASKVIFNLISFKSITLALVIYIHEGSINMYYLLALFVGSSAPKRSYAVIHLFWCIFIPAGHETNLIIPLYGSQEFSGFV